MKKQVIYPLLSVLFLSSLMYFGCKKEQFKDVESTYDYSSALMSYSFSGVSNVGGILHFADIDALLTIYDSLDAHMYDYTDSIPDSVCLGGVFPVLDSFEMALNFHSIRREFEMQECVDLDNGVDPDDLKHCHIMDEILASFVNTDYLVQIEDTVYYWQGDDMIYFSHASDAYDRLGLVKAGLSAPEAGVDLGPKYKKDDDCEADFNYSVSQSTGVITITYTGSSSPTRRISWTYPPGGAGQQINITNFNFTVTTPGTYTVCVTVQNDKGTPSLLDDCEETICKDIVVDFGCIADFDWSEGSNGQVCFTNKSSVSPGAITGYHWDFGDGVGTSTQQNPCYTYNCNSVYNVTLTIYSANCLGGQKQVTKKVEVTGYQCCDRRPKKGWIPEPYNEPNNKLEWKYSMGSDYVWDQRLIAKMKNYVRKPNGKWKKQNIHMEIDFSPHLYSKDEDDCTCEETYDIFEDPAGSEYCKNIQVKDKLLGIRFNRELNWLKNRQTHPLLIDFKAGNPYVDPSQQYIMEHVNTAGQIICE